MSAASSTPIVMTQLNKSELNENILVKSGLAEFIRDIKLGKFERSYDVAKRSVVIIVNIIKDNNWSKATDLIQALKCVCAYIDKLELVETAASNMTRRIMRIIRDECHNYNSQLRAQQDQAVDSLSLSSAKTFAQKPAIHEHSIGSSSSTSSGYPGGASGRLDESGALDSTSSDHTNLDLDIYKTGVHENILEGIEQELMNELDLSSRIIAQQAIDYVQTDEIILTLGKSKVIETFLRHAAIGNTTGRRKFTVIVVELAPFYSGREMARSLNKIGISTLIIPDSAVFAIMSRVNKVLLGTHSMMANGGIKAPAGSHSIALAAKHYAVPVIVCCPMYKLTPNYLVSHDSEAFEHFSHLHTAFPEPYTTPTEISTERGIQEKGNIDAKLDSSRPESTISCGCVESIHSTFDYVQPELITLFVSNIGGNSPSYVYQLLNELYCKSDYLN